MATIPSIALIPSGYKASKVYSVLPTDGTGDFYFTRSGNATRVNSDGLIEEVLSNVPRLNYPLIDGVVQDCPSLLLEPQRTNNLQRSEEFENAYWVNNGVTITANQIISPSGLLNADLLTGVSGGFGIVRFSTWTATNKVASCFAKAGATNIFKIANVSAVGGFVLFDLSNGTVFEQSAGWTGFIENYGNGWYRCTAISNNETGTFSLGVTAASESVYIWGAQLEAGTYATSYIPTTSSISTRSAETCNGAGDASTFNDSEGVLFAEISALANSGDFRNISISDGTINNRIQLYYRPDANKFTVLLQENGNVLSATTINVVNALDFMKLIINWDGTNYKVYVNGLLVNTSTYNSPTGLNRLDFAEVNGSSNPFYGNIKQIQYFNTALSDEELTLLTTL